MTGMQGNFMPGMPGMPGMPPFQIVSIQNPQGASLGMYPMMQGM